MGVYIPNWKKPKSCDECWAEYAYEICNSHSDCCPLVEIPPHGRLGDLDELKERATKRLYASNHVSMAEAYYAATIDLIDSAPTIIPAEEGE